MIVIFKKSLNKHVPHMNKRCVIWGTVVENGQFLCELIDGNPRNNRSIFESLLLKFLGKLKKKLPKASQKILLKESFEYFLKKSVKKFLEKKLNYWTLLGYLESVDDFLKESKEIFFNNPWWNFFSIKSFLEEFLMIFLEVSLVEYLMRILGEFLENFIEMFWRNPWKTFRKQSLGKFSKKKETGLEIESSVIRKQIQSLN